MSRDLQLETWFSPERVRLSRFVFLLAIAEAVTAIQAWPGAVLHVVLLSWLAWRSATTDSETEGLLLAGLMMLPIMRIASLILLLGPLPEDLWQVSVAVLVAIAAVVVVRRLHISAQEIGLKSSDLMQQLPLAGIALAVGAIGFALLPEASLPLPSRSEALLAAVFAVVVATVMEELLLRGFVLMLSVPLLGPLGSLAFSALVATSLQLGYGSVSNIALALGTSIVYGYLVLRSGSILGVVLGHALANVLFFVLVPMLGADWLGVALLGMVVGVVAFVGLRLIQRPPSGGLRAGITRVA
jgi:membrane protease YdiL (CAAX protease family)